METKTRIRRSRYRPPGQKENDAASGRGTGKNKDRSRPGSSDPLGMKLDVYAPKRERSTVSSAARLSPADRRRRLKKARSRQRRLRIIKKGVIAAAAVLVLLLGTVGVRLFLKGRISLPAGSGASGASADQIIAGGGQGEAFLSESPEEEIEFHPHSVPSTEPSNLIESTGIEVNGTELDSIAQYRAQAPISFGTGSAYTDVDGIVTFRGNSFRDSPSYGTADLKENRIQKIWMQETGSLTSGDAYWSGSGWTGQPLMQKWPRQVKAHMNMYDWAKEDDDLVEVIYACMDGYVYFMDLKTGRKTRDDFFVGFTFKGAGALDPRGYPLMYLGAGYDNDEETARAFIISLLDCSILYTFGNDDPYSLRGHLSFFDSSALVDAETDTLIYPGESGILYLLHLNTSYSEESGTLSINPDPIVKWRYNGVRTDWEQYWLGIEDSACFYKNYIFMADNGGNLMCLDLNTLELVWVQDVLDDSNSTPILSIENGHLYIYISTSFHLGWRSEDTASVPIWKIDAETGEILWHTDYECFSDDGVSGGVISSPAIGRHGLDGRLYVTMAMTGTHYGGVLTCLNTETGKVEWEHTAYYAWSSPVCVYTPEGEGRVVYCTSGGTMYFLDGKTGKVLDIFDFGDDNVEASPAVYNNILVVGTRDCKIYGFELL